jgi:hypothetical protein
LVAAGGSKFPFYVGNTCVDPIPHSIAILLNQDVDGKIVDSSLIEYIHIPLKYFHHVAPVQLKTNGWVRQVKAQAIYSQIASYELV